MKLKSRYYLLYVEGNQVPTYMLAVGGGGVA